jgi:hypothetical protein
MKHSSCILSTLVVLALGGVCLFQQHLLRKSRSELTAMRQQLAQVEAELQEKTEAVEKTEFAERKAALLQKTLTDVSDVAAEKTRHVEQLKESLANVNTNSPDNALATMLKDPQMKEMIRTQQKAVIGPMLEKQYAALFRQLKLTPDQTAQFKELIEQKMLAAADMGTSMIGSNLDAQGRADLVKQMKEQNDQYDQQIKQMLGDENYTAYKDYEKTVGDRYQLSQFRDQVAGTSAELNPSQEQQLLQTMQEERSNFKWSVDFNKARSGSEDVNFAELFTEDNVNKFLQEQEQLDQQVITRSGQFLNSDQLAAFEKNLTVQRNMQATSMRMAAKMFGTPKKP